jgi:mannitol/fructose-specific phosphotransferase system IIA component (Ntr-type)
VTQTLLTDILSEPAVLLDLDVETKDAALAALVDLLAGTGVVTDRELMLQDLHNRERMMSTGIGGGIAVPHAQSAGATHLALALGRLARPVDFQALDHKPVALVFLVVGPKERRGFIPVLARIARLLYQEKLKSTLLRARTPAEVMEIIRFEEARITG